MAEMSHVFGLRGC